MKTIRTTALTAALVLSMLLASCGTAQPGFSVGTSPDGSIDEQKIASSAADVTYTDADPYDYMANDLTGFIKLGEYTGLSVTKESDILTDEEFEDEIDAMLDSYSYYETVTDRQVEEGETVLADYSGYLDGVQFDGGTAANQTITAASGTGYIEGFAEAFIGQMPGVEFDFDVTFPSDYGNADLAGKEVTFVCTIHSIQGDELIVPELTDEFVSETFGYNNVEEFRILFRESVEKQKAYYVESNMYSELWLKVVDNAEVLGYPGEEVERIYGERRAMYEEYAGYYGVDYETFLTNYVGMSDSDLYAESEKYVKEDLVMYQIIKELNFELTDDVYTEGIAFFTEYYGATEEELLSYYGEDTLRTTILGQELMKKIAETAVITEG
ncbi:MAG: FKBP-type peptidyl-prolyl cis-trans isomerase [Clostridia bacterium]|nr:FKBP-type peptidyl-prolyl cis-trans isomerase [Clostridia bacterium]